ncbi:hypothetical protein V3C99_003152 [Haemonchus contortus]
MIGDFADEMERSKLGKPPKFRRRASSTLTLTTVEDDGTQVERRPRRKSRRPTARTHAADQAVFKEAFKMFCDRTLKMGVTALSDEFMKLKMATQSIGNRPKTAWDANPDKNRYREVFCIDTTRVVLTWPSGMNDYINANWVSSVEKQKKFICTQGPMDKTVDDFWRMVWQEKCRSIVMLCNIMECGKQKCEQYWPLNAESPMKLPSGLTVKFVSSDAIENSVDLTKVSVCDDSGHEHSLEHFHWKDWPDRGVPATTTLSIFRLLRKVNRLTPCVVHCSAGIGRTGTVVGIDLLYRRLEKGEKDATLLNVVSELREMRHGAVQMDVQYLYMHRILLVVAENLKIITPEETQKFTSDYDQMLKTRGFV